MKRTIGFIKSHKENEKRRALLPSDMQSIQNRSKLYFETGYGDVLNIHDGMYESLGCKVVTREEALSQDIICDPKVGDAEYISLLNRGQVVFGWVHAVQNRLITDCLIDGLLTVYAWEEMFENGRHVFWRNNELAGEAAIIHAFMCYGLLPEGINVAVLGRGNIAMGAAKSLYRLGAYVNIYNRDTEYLFRQRISEYDVLVNAILWDTSRNDHIIYKEDLKKMKPGAMIIDISCDEEKAVETTKATTIENPIYEIDGIIHYAVDHTPSLFYKSASKVISNEVAKYVDLLIERRENDVLHNSRIIRDGQILDQKIVDYQARG